VDLEGTTRDFADGLRQLADRIEHRVAHDLYAAPPETRATTATTTGPAVVETARVTFHQLLADLDRVVQEARAA
jgi:hypothetical protein